MGLPNDVVKQFAKIATMDYAVDKKNVPSYTYGTVVIEDGKTYVRIDGAECMTPVSQVIAAENGDRALLMINNHTATILGNMSSPAQTIKVLEANYAKISQLETLNAYIENLESVNITTDNLSAQVAKISSLTADDAIIRVIRAEVLDADTINAAVVNAGYLTADSADIKYAKIDYANVDTATIRQGFLTDLMVSQGIVADRIVGTEVVATDVLTGVSIYADDITAGTLSVDRLVFRGTENSIVYQLNQITGALQAANVETINGEVITPRSITADRIIAKSITSNEINVENLVATGLINANKLTSNNIDVNNLFAQKIYASGSIESTGYARYSSDGYSSGGIKLDMATGEIVSPNFLVDKKGDAHFKGKLAAPSGTIGGFTIGANAIYKGTESLISKNAGVYLGTDGVSVRGGSANYVNISNGKIIGRNNRDSVMNPVDAVIDLEFSNALLRISRLSADATGLTMWFWDDRVQSTQAVKVGTCIEFSINGLQSFDVYKETNGTITKRSPAVNLLTADGTAKNAVTATTAAKLGRDGNTGLPMIFHWSGQAGQPPWLWGGTDGTNMYVYNPANFSVKSATSAGTATKAIQDGNGNNIVNTYLPKTGGTISGALTINSGEFLSNVNIKINNAKWFITKNTAGIETRLLGMNSSNSIHMGDYNGANGSPVYLHTKGVVYDFLQTTFRPGDTGARNLGDASHIWKTVYAKTGTINTSDRTKKHDIHAISEVYEQLFLRLQPKSFMFNDGDRVHIGAISQDVEDAMKELGIAPEQFAGFCKDIRYEYTEFNEEDGTPVEASKVPCTDEDGNLIYDYALRYQEFIFLTVHMVQRLWEQKESFETKLNALEEENRVMKSRMKALEEKLGKLLEST